MEKSPYAEARMYLEGLIVILDSIEDREDPSMNAGILIDIHEQIGKLKDKVISLNN